MSNDNRNSAAPDITKVEPAVANPAPPQSQGDKPSTDKLADPQQK